MREYNPRKYIDKEAEQKEQEERLKIVHDQRIRDLAHVLKSEEGRRWVYGLLERCHVFHTVMTGNSYTFFNEGMRQIGLMLIDEMSQVGPKVYGDLHAESFKWKAKVDEILNRTKREVDQDA